MGENKVLLFPQKVKSRSDAAIECHERLGGILPFYHRKAARAVDVVGKGGVPARFGGVGAWLARRNSAVFCWSVVFPEIGGDGYF